VKASQYESTQGDCSLLEMHDNIRQQMFALALRVGSLKLLFKQNPDVALEKLQEIEDILQTIHVNLNSIEIGLSQKRSDLL